MPQLNRWPAEIVTHKFKCPEGEIELHCKVDFSPDGRPHGFKIWRTDKMGTGHILDEGLDEISRKGSRVLQRRYP
jgi:hypothetical protein